MSHSFLRRLPLGGLFSAAAISAAVAIAPAPASAVCLSGDLVANGTDCQLFNPSSDSQATNRFNDPDLNATPYAQMGFRTNAALGDVQITGISWFDDSSATWVNFTPTNLSPVGGSYVYTNPFDFSPSVAGAPLLTRFTIESGSSLVSGDIVQSILVASAIGSVDGNGRLNESQTIGDAFLLANRNQEAVPGPLPLLGAGAAFSYSRRLRRRISSGAKAAV